MHQHGIKIVVEGFDRPGFVLERIWFFHQDVPHTAYHPTAGLSMMAQLM